MNMANSTTLSDFRGTHRAAHENEISRLREIDRLNGGTGDIMYRPIPTVVPMYDRLGYASNAGDNSLDDERARLSMTAYDITTNPRYGDFGVTDYHNPVNGSHVTRPARQNRNLQNVAGTQQFQGMNNDPYAVQSTSYATPPYYGLAATQMGVA